MAKQKIEFKPGDRVAFSRAFLQSTGQLTGAAPFARGVVERLDDLGPGFTIAAVLWDGAAEAHGVNTGNLVLVSRIALEPV